MSSKTLVNKALKDLGLGFIKMTVGSGFHATQKCITDIDEKRIKGIHCTSHSPTDVTNAADNRIAKITANVRQHMAILLGSRDEDSGRYTVCETSKKITQLSLCVQVYPTYDSWSNTDEGYVTTYMVPTYYTVKK